MFDKLQESLVYGPVDSRRLGKSIGINLFPNDQFKICSFNCTYCFFKCSSTKIENHSFNDISDNLIKDLEHWRINKQNIFSNSDYLTFSGNGEPIVHPKFSETVESVYEWKKKNANNKKIAIFTNGSHLNIEKIRNAVLKCDNIFIKLDVGNEEDFLKIYRPNQSIKFKDYIEGIKYIVGEGKQKNKNITIQTAILETNLTDSQGVDLKSLIETIKEIKPILFVH